MPKVISRARRQTPQGVAAISEASQTPRLPPWREALDHARTVQAAGPRVFGPEHPHLPHFAQQVADLEAKLKE